MTTRPTAHATPESILAADIEEHNRGVHDAVAALFGQLQQMGAIMGRATGAACSRGITNTATEIDPEDEVIVLHLGEIPEVILHSLPEFFHDAFLVSMDKTSKNAPKTLRFVLGMLAEEKEGLLMIIPDSRDQEERVQFADVPYYKQTMEVLDALPMLDRDQSLYMLLLMRSMLGEFVESAQQVMQDNPEVVAEQLAGDKPHVSFDIDANGRMVQGDELDQENTSPRAKSWIGGAGGKKTLQ